MESGKWKATSHVDVWPPCPRCGSSNTKFCYYNNYSLTQPRYFCKACRRYWTKGGSLRNVPVGGGCRKTRRPKSVRSRNDHVDQSSSFPDPQQTPTPTSIDLAAVYANFVNPRQTQVPAVEFSSVHGNLPHQETNNGFFECQQFPMFDNSFVSMDIPMGNDLLPPLPGEEALLMQPTWPNSDSAVLHNRGMNPDQGIIGGDVHQVHEQSEENSELIMNGSMSMFSGLNLEAIFRTT